LEALTDWSVASLHENLLNLAKKLEVKNGVLLWPVRVAAAGQTVTPGGAMEILSLLGKEESLHRLQAGLDKLKK
jgi:glutamyl-tRNA synthetase